MARRRVHVGFYCAALLLSGLMWLSLPSRALACSCMAMPIEEQVERFREMGDDARIFEGRATGMEQTDSSAPIRYRFAVRQAWLGEFPAELEVETPPDSAACGTTFELERDHLVFASRVDGVWTTTLCDPNMASDDPQAVEAVALLGAAAPPSDAAAGSDLDSGSRNMLIGLGIVVIGALAFIFIERNRQQRIRSLPATTEDPDEGA